MPDFAREKTDLNLIMKESLSTFEEANRLCSSLQANLVKIEDLSKCMELRDKIENLIGQILEIQTSHFMVELNSHPLPLVGNPAAQISAQIQVTDQNTTKDTYAACGYHAIKNALIGIALAYTNPNRSQEVINLFNDARFFNSEIHPFLNSLRLREGDITIATLTEGLNKIRSMEFDKQKFPNLNKLSEVLQIHPHSLSGLNFTESCSLVLSRL